MGELYPDNIERLLHTETDTEAPFPQVMEHSTEQPRVMPGLFMVYEESDCLDYCK